MTTKRTARRHPNDIAAESPANQDLHELHVALSALCDKIDAFRCQHAAGCCCDYCGTVPRDQTLFLLTTLDGIRWAAEVADSVVDAVMFRL
jgi:hypothetical protein